VTRKSPLASPRPANVSGPGRGGAYHAPHNDKGGYHKKDSGGVLQLPNENTFFTRHDYLHASSKTSSKVCTLFLKDSVLTQYLPRVF
jgi:hypothetical protein